MSDSQTDATLVLLWIRQHFQLDASDWYDTVDEAVGGAWATTESGTGVPHAVEAWYADGSYRHIGRVELDQLIEERQTISERLLNAHPRHWLGRIEVHPPDGVTEVGGRGQAGWVTYRRYEKEQSLEDDYRRLHAVLGDRVRRVEETS